MEKYGHQPRLYAIARQIAEGIPCDHDVLYAAAWLHDVGVFIGHRPEDPAELSRWDCVAYAITITPGVLLQVGFPEHKVPDVIEAIRTHQPQCSPTTMEGTILRDADILEQLGAIAVVRTVCKVGRDTRFTSFTNAVASLRKSLNDLPAQIRLESTHALAQPKIEILRKFLEAAETESGEFLL